MTGRVSVVVVMALSFAVQAQAASADAEALLQQLQEQVRVFEEQRAYDGSPLTLDAALDEAL